MRVYEQTLSEYMTRQLEPHAVFKIIHDQFTGQIRARLSINPPEFNKRYIKPVIKKEPAEWTNGRVARFVRWMLRNKWRAKLIPYSVECWANAHYVTVGWESEEFSQDVLHNIYEQIVYWKLENKQPHMILVGVESYQELVRTLDFSVFQPHSLAQPNKDCFGQIAGLPCVRCNHIKGFLVIPKL